MFRSSAVKVDPECLGSEEFKLLVVNSDSKSFNEKNWIESETYYSKKQKKLLISDMHTRKYKKLSNNDKRLMEERIWFNLWLKNF